mgnify:CR=1 FL=1
MATTVSSQFSICFCVLLLVHDSMAQLFYPRTNPWHSPHQGSFSEYRFDRLQAFESLQKVRSEGGVTEYVDERNELFQHTGTFVIRRVIQPQGLLVPRYTNTLSMVYIIQGLYDDKYNKKFYQCSWHSSTYDFHGRKNMF